VPVRIHGALVEVRGVGALLLGPSGIGKSECALELVRRGHRLVADDVVVLEREAGGRLVGSGPERIRHHLELRGIGVVYVPDLYGPGAVAERSPVGLAFRFEAWHPEADVERVGIERPTERWDGVEIPTLRVPVRPAASLATLVEVGVQDHALRQRGLGAADRLDARLREEAVRR
jgi:HPr kinase/phosphorylase